MASDEAFAEWRARPERSAAGALLGLVSSWILGAGLLLAMIEPIAGRGEAALSGAEYLLIMSVPAATLTVTCVVAKGVRRWSGYFVPGVAVGWLLGWLTFVLLGLLAAIA